jgi:hypothetical protein
VANREKTAVVGDGTWDVLILSVNSGLETNIMLSKKEDKAGKDLTFCPQKLL